MYPLLAIDSMLRIAIALAVLFIVVPRLAWPKTREQDGFERFWWDAAAGVTLLTIAGQLLTLAKLYALPTLLLLFGVVILLGRSVRARRSPVALLRDGRRWLIVATLNLLERRVSLRRRMRRAARRLVRSMRTRLASPRQRVVASAWILVLGTAAIFRLYRPWVTANLGFSDSYVHLYLLKLLERGQQIDPAWGPYPRGMHFLLLAIQRLTNIDETLLVNFFGAFAGILITFGVATAARRFSRSTAGGVVAALLFATMTGSASQYFVLGGSFESTDPSAALAMTAAKYSDLPLGLGEYDPMFIAFQRQTSSLSQELAFAFLFPAAMFLFLSFRRKCAWDAIGFFLCVAAIAATHSGVLVPLVLLSAVVALAAMTSRQAGLRLISLRAAGGAFAIVAGSTWMLGYLSHPLSSVQRDTAAASSSGTALFYFPFLRSLMKEPGAERVFVANTITPFLLVLGAGAIALLAAALLGSRHRRAPRVIVAVAFLLFLFVHVSSRLGIPELVESRRNAAWFLASIAILVATLAVEFGRAAFSVASLSRKRGAVFAALVAMAFWIPTIPAPAAMRDRIVNYSGYGSAALAVVEIAHSFEPFSWTVVSYGQEFPMVLGRGFAIPASDFLERYDPLSPVLAVPTPNVFLIVERVPHRFEVNDWRARFRRGEIEERLATWWTLYRATHDDARLFLSDEHVDVYMIQRSEAEAGRIAQEAAR